MSLSIGLIDVDVHHYPNLAMIDKQDARPCHEIRRNGETVCVSSLPCCGYPVRMLRDMMAAGYQYVVDGKIVRKV